MIRKKLEIVFLMTQCCINLHIILLVILFIGHKTLEPN